MDYIQFFNMGTAKSILKKSANDWLGTNHELSKSEDSIKRKHVHELKRIFQILLDHQGLKVLGTVTDKDWSSRSQKTVAGCVGNAPGRRVSARSGG